MDQSMQSTEPLLPKIDSYQMNIELGMLTMNGILIIMITVTVVCHIT